MAVYKTKSGRWKAKINYRDDYGNVKTKEKTFNLKREAQDYESVFRSNLNQMIDESMTYGDLVYEYLQTKSVSVTPSTLHDQKFLLNKFTKHLFIKKYSSLKKSDYFKVYDTIVASYYSWSRKNRSIMLLKAVSHYGNTRHNFDDLARPLQTLRKRDGDEQVFDIWTPEQFDIFNQNVDNYTLKCMFRTLYYTGMRRGECRALLKSDLDTTNKCLSVTKSMRRNTANRLKTASSRRMIALDDDTFKMLLPLLDVEGEYLFGGLESISNSMLQREFVKGKERANVKLDEPLPDIRIHDFRHSHASVLINNGANIVAVSKRLGHSDINTTLRRYTHLMQKSDDEVLKIINEL